MIVDEGQRLVDDVHDIVEIYQQQHLCTYTLNREIDVADQHVGAGIDSDEIRDPRIQIKLGGQAVDFEKDAIHAEIRNVEHHVVLGELLRPWRPAGHSRTGNSTASCTLTRQTVSAQSSIECA